MTRKIFTPRAYHELAVGHLLAHKRCSLFARPGMGKTILTLSALDALYFSGIESKPTLILGPKRVAEEVWSNEAAKWDHLRDIIVSPVVGTSSERAAAMLRDASVYTTNYENIPWLIEHLGDRWPFGTVVADESTKLKNFRGSAQVSKTGKEFIRAGGTKRSSALAKLAHDNVHRWINLTGTPASNGLGDLWGQMWFVDQGRRLGRTHGGFEGRWFRQVPGKGDYPTLEPTPYAQAEIEARIKDVCLTLDPKDWFDLKDPIVTIVPVELPTKARNLYRQMEKDYFIEIAGQGIEALNAASKSQKLLQLASGAVYLAPDDGSDTKPWTEVHDAKIQALESILNESGGMPILVAYNFKSDLARLRKAFPKAKVLSKKQELADYKTGKYPMGLVQPASLGHGVDGLQDVGNILVFFSLDWNLENHEQVIERIGPMRQLQSGSGRDVHLIFCVAKDTIDEIVFERLQSKKSVQDCLMAAMKQRGI